jgi:hypothetical protein
MNARKSTKVLSRSRRLTAVAALVIAGLAAPASAADKVVGEFGWFGVGKTYELEKGHYFWVGEFSGSFFNDKGEGSTFHRAGVKCPGWLDLDFNTKRSQGGGTCIVTELDGDQVFLSWRNAGAPGPGGRGPGTFEYTGGTGKYKGISGSNTFVGVTQVNYADGTASGYASWNR